MDTPRVFGTSRVSNYFECFPDEKLIPNVNLDYLRGARAAYNICVKLTRALNVPWMILVTTMAYWHRFFYVPAPEQEKRTKRRIREEEKRLLSQHQKTEDNNNNNSRSRSVSINLDSVSALLDNNEKLLVFENDAINHDDECEIYCEEKTFEKYHPVLVAVAAFFLALKTECVHRPLKTIVTHAFQISSSSNEYSIRREQVIRLELMLMHSLNFHLFQELPWGRAMELLPQQQQQQNLQNQSYGSDPQVNTAMLALFQKVLGYLVQFPLQACLSGNAIAECAVWFVADCVEAPNHYKEHLLKLFNSTNEITRQKFASHILDHMAFFDRPEVKEYPKLGAKVTALKTRIRMQYGGNGNGNGGGSGSNNHNNNSSNHFGFPTSNNNVNNTNGNGGARSSSVIPFNSNGNNNNNGNSNAASARGSVIVNPYYSMANNSNPNGNNNNNNNNNISPVPATSTNNVNNNNNNHAIPLIRQREEHQQPFSIRRMPNQQQQQPPQQ